MTVTTRPPAGRLPSRRPAREERGREVRLGLLASLGLLAALVGVPVALVLAVGNPLPTSMPSRDWLTADVSATTVVKVLAVALWVVWAHFVVCVLSEWRALRRGRGLPGDVPFGGGTQLLARRLVATALLLAGAATLAPTASPAPGPSAVSASVQESRPAAPDVVESAGADTAAGPAVAATKSYTVALPEGRRYDCLWDIAERTLGDPYRYKEIFALNRDRRQPDGSVLVDADLIRPGWVLQLPADATGPGVEVQAVAPLQRPAADIAPVAAGSAQAAPELRAPQVSAPTVEQDSGLGRDLLGGGLLAAGLLVALTARRGPYVAPTDTDAEQRLRLSADPGRADLLNRGLRQLAAACAAQGIALPEVALAGCSDDELLLSLVGTAASPPAPWTALSGGRGWLLRSADLDAGSPDVPAPYPALVGIAVSEGEDVLVDLETAPGLIALVGDQLVAREVATSLAVELATNTWSDGVRVTLVGFGDDLTAVAPTTLTAADRLADILPELEDDARRVREALRTLGVDGVLSGRLARRAERSRPHVVVLSGPPTPQEIGRLQGLVHNGRTPLAVLCVGNAAGAQWRFALDARGDVDLGVLGVQAPARRLPTEQYGPVLELLAAADTERAEAMGTVSALTPRSAAAAAKAAASSVPAGTALAQRTGRVAVQVSLLGPVEVRAPGPVEPAARALLTEVVVAAALSRDGLHEATLRAQVWPRGVGDDVLAATITKVQAWLGSDDAGRPRLSRADDGRFQLAGDVHCDWDALRSCAASARGTSELATLGGALSLVRGPACSQVPAERYGWLAFHRAARDARVVGTAAARRAASLATADGDRASAERLLRAGLTLVPTAEPLWRDLLRLTGSDDPGSAGVLAEQMYAALAAHDLRAEPETDALVQQLAPGTPAHTTAGTA